MRERARMIGVIVVLLLLMDENTDYYKSTILSKRELKNRRV
jgi:hypothetical protein